MSTARYTRTLADLPWQGILVRLHVQVRRFCDMATCGRRMFTERLPQVATPYARGTTRLTDVTRALGCVIGGEGGARLAARLGIQVSPDTLLRRVRQSVSPAPPVPRVLGVDDGAKRKGQP